jgi:hypothetical protein
MVPPVLNVYISYLQSQSPNLCSYIIVPPVDVYVPYLIHHVIDCYVQDQAKHNTSGDILLLFSFVCSHYTSSTATIR